MPSTSTTETEWPTLLDEGDVLVDECVTGDDGTCTIGGLHLGDYYWYETEAPEGYLIRDDATTDVVTISAENAGTGPSVAAFLDPPLPTTPPPDLRTPVCRSRRG